MNIFTRKKKLLATIANLEEQIRIQSNEMDKLRKANTDLNRLWQEERKTTKEKQDRIEDLANQLRGKGMEYADAIGEKNQEIESLKKQIGEMKDTNNGLASSVSELKTKIREKNTRIRDLCHRIDDLKAHQPKRQQRGTGETKETLLP